MDLGAEKLKYFENKTQLILLRPDGTVADSDNTLIAISEESKSLFDLDPFLEGIKDALFGLDLNEEMSFPCIGQQLLGRQGYFDLVFKKIEDNGSKLIKWTIIDLTEYYNLLIPIQQERNELDIQGEFLQIQQKAITLEKKLLEFQNSELKRVKKFKEEFFAQVSHEMRTPLNSIVGITDLLMESTNSSPDQPKMHEYLQDLKDTSNHLKAIVSDILDLSKIEAGKIELESQVFNLKDTINSIANSFGYTLSKKGIDLKTKIDEDIPSFLEGDRQKLTQILFNILGNAVKYTEKGHIDLRLQKLKTLERNIELQFTISDTGIGMSNKDVETIFEPYSRTKEVKEKLYEGTGLGMSIVEKLVHAMGGEIQISSSRHQGTEVGITLPFTSAEYKDGTQLPDKESTNGFEFAYIKKVLIAEDDPMASKIMIDSLMTMGLDVKGVGTGEAILEELEKSYYDLIILDNQLPGLQGIEAAAQVRIGNYPEYSKNLPVLIISGEKLSATPPHVDAHLTKPFSINQLGNELNRIDSDLVNSKLVNPRYLMEITENNSDLIIELLDIFIRDMPANLKSMKEMAERSEFNGLIKLLHKTIPNVQYIGIAGLDHMMERLESDILVDPEGIDFETRFGEIEELCTTGLNKLELQKEELLSKL